MGTGDNASRGRLTLVGGGGHARVLAEAARLEGWKIVGVLDDHERPALCESNSIERLGPLDSLSTSLADGVWFILALGSITLRRRLLDALPDGFDERGGRVVHPGAIVSSDAQIGPGVFVGPGAIVNTGARLGAHAIINSGAIVEHDVEVGRGAHLAPGVALGGGARVGEDALVGLGARVLPGVRVGAGALVGAGAVVIEDVPVGRRVAGVPAREIGPDWNA
ncbi:MAG: NeuD/PglB/VioB family sugar acetyltransferase [Phycisphaerales bacterium]